jgi:predicted small lipoprotein YifL
MTFQKVLAALLILAFATSLSACGRKNKPIAPDDVEVTYPRTYPAPAPVPGE